MPHTQSKDLIQANIASNGKTMLAVSADIINPNGGYLVSISQESNPNPIVFDHRQIDSVRDVLDDAYDLVFYGEKIHATLAKRKLEDEAKRGLERPPAVLSAVWYKDSKTYTVSATTGSQNEVTGLLFDKHTISDLIKDLYGTKNRVNALIEENHQRMGVIAREINEAQQASGLWREIHMNHDGSYMRFVGVEAGLGCELTISDDGWATIIVTRNGTEFKKTVLLGRQAIHDYIWLLYEEAMGGRPASSYS